MAQGRAESTLKQTNGNDAEKRLARLPDWEHFRALAFVTEISDEDYRCVWRPCHELEEEPEAGEEDVAEKK